MHTVLLIGRLFGRIETQHLRQETTSRGGWLAYYIYREAPASNRASAKVRQMK